MTNNLIFSIKIFFKIDLNVDSIEQKKFVRWNDDDDDVSNEYNENVHAIRYWNEKFENNDDKCKKKWKFWWKFSKFDDQRIVRQIRILFSNHTLIEIFLIRTFRIFCNSWLLIDRFVEFFRCFDDRDFEKRNFEQNHFAWCFDHYFQFELSHDLRLFFLFDHTWLKFHCFLYRYDFWKWKYRRCNF